MAADFGVNNIQPDKAIERPRLPRPRIAGGYDVSLLTKILLESLKIYWSLVCPESLYLAPAASDASTP